MAPIEAICIDDGDVMNDNARRGLRGHIRIPANAVSTSAVRW